jgi:hydroxyacylglutathione hydrolase
VGFSNFGGYLLGGMEHWENAALPISRLDQMPVQALNAALPSSGLQVVDVRSPDEWEKGHVPGASYIFLPELKEKSERLDENKPVAVYCDSGYRASLAVSLLRRDGFTEVHNVPGSWKAWLAAGYDVEKPKEQKKSSDTDR